MISRALKTAVLILLFSSSIVARAADAPTIFLVRHAEKAGAGQGSMAGTSPADPDLSAAGRRRSESLAFALKDAGIKTIFVTEYKRTQETAAPLAAQAGLTPMKLPADGVAELVKRLEGSSGGGNILVVGHSNTVPEIIKSLGIATPVTMGESEFGDLFVVTGSGDSRRLVHLHYR